MIDTLTTFLQVCNYHKHMKKNTLTFSQVVWPSGL